MTHLDSQWCELIPQPRPIPLCGTLMNPFAIDIDPYIEFWRLSMEAHQVGLPVDPADTYNWNKSVTRWGMVDVGGKAPAPLEIKFMKEESIDLRGPEKSQEIERYMEFDGKPWVRPTESCSQFSESGVHPALREGT
ncbi:hypothetical protein FB451DRAFT_1178754 [Mycena latifolia]|nr:hypothetical protein FB451DRAFT_1178754 [Mycena latifolia]